MPEPITSNFIADGYQVDIRRCGSFELVGMGDKGLFVQTLKKHPKKRKYAVEFFVQERSSFEVGLVHWVRPRELEIKLYNGAGDHESADQSAIPAAPQ